MSTNEMTTTIKELKELKSMMTELSADISALEDRIKAEMTAQGVDELTICGHKITWKEVTSTRLDTKEIQKHHPKTCEKFLKTSTTRRFCIA